MISSANLEHDLNVWIDHTWDPQLSLSAWRALLVDGGWAKPSLPCEWFGRGLSDDADAIVTEVLERRAIPGLPEGAGVRLVLPTLLAHGTVELRRRLVRRILTGEDTWCQLFSEPGCGSDLAGLTTRAVATGREYVVTGQKLWSTSADHANYGILLARTDWDAPKHQGITCFALPMRQPAVHVRPLKQMNGKASFNEVFLDDARVEAASVIGSPGGGWGVARTTLAHERRLSPHRSVSSSRRPGRACREAFEEAQTYLATYDWYPQRGGRPDLVVEHARLRGRTSDPVIRQQISALVTLERTSQWTAQRLRAASGAAHGSNGSISKLNASRVATQAARVHAAIAGVAGTVRSDTALAATIVEVQLSVPAVSIAGGTDEIQKNVIAERILGLPREQDLFKDVPSRDIPRNERL